MARSGSRRRWSASASAKSAFFLWQPSPLGFEVQATQDALAKNYLWPCDAPVNIVNVSSKAPSSFGSFTYQSLYNTYNGTVTVTNTSSSRITGPLNLVISNLPSGCQRSECHWHLQW